MKIELKEWDWPDLEQLMLICNSANRDYLRNRLPNPYTEKDAKWWIEMVRENDGKTGIFRAVLVDGSIVGNISVEQKDDVFYQDSEIGYMLMTSWWSKGIMTEAVKQICRFAFETLDIMRISGVVYSPNMASRKVLERNGFQLEGVLRKAVYKDGNVYDKCLYGLLRDELTEL